MNNIEKAFWMLVGSIDNILDAGTMGMNTRRVLERAKGRAKKMAMEPGGGRDINNIGLHAFEVDVEKFAKTIEGLLKDLDSFDMD